jgi:hypothetical protein
MFPYMYIDALTHDICLDGKCPKVYCKVGFICYQGFQSNMQGRSEC